jgi:ferric-dicitrate binding protein FerR (iron transport regulator)
MDKEYLLKKWLNNDLTQEEEVLFKSLDDFSSNQAIISSAESFKASNFNTIDNFDDFKNYYSERESKTTSLNWKSPFLRIASVIIVAATLYSAFYFNRNTEIQTLASEKTTIELPDASQVIMNSVSEISYNRHSWQSSRTLNLKGEAFFKVSKGNTFDVVTSSGVVTVVGTEFNVKQRDNFFYVECFEGIVSVKSDTLTRLLHAGDSFKIYQGVLSESHAQQQEPYWMNNSSSFHAIALKDVLSELERQYNIEITHENINLENLFTGGFTHTNLKEALISITQPMNLSYKMNSSNRVVLYENKN